MNLESARVCVVATALLVVLPIRSTRAQVNTENLRKRIKTVGYSVIVEGTLTGDVGNTQGISVGGGLGGGWARDPHLLFAYARFDYTKYAGVTSVDKSFAHVRYNYEFAPWIWGEVFAQAESDEFQRLTLRNLFGAGPRARLAHVVADDGPSEEAKLPAAANPSPEAQKAATHAPTETFDVFVGSAYMLERDAIVPVVGHVLKGIDRPYRVAAFQPLDLLFSFHAAFPQARDGTEDAVRREDHERKSRSGALGSLHSGWLRAVF